MYGETFYQDNKGAQIVRIVQNKPRAAEAFRTDSRELLRLPQEIRQKIFCYLYTDSDPNHQIIVNDFPDVDDRQHTELPDDPYCYMNASIVDPYVAAEVATTFYSTNYFTFRSNNYEDFAWFLRSDHYGSDVVPRDVITRLYLAQGMHGFMDLFMPSEFASQLRDFVFGRSASLAFSKNSTWCPVLEAKNLRFVEFQLWEKWPKSAPTPEMVMLKMLEERGVSTNMRLTLVPERGFGASRDYSRVFNKPTEGEVLAVGDKKPIDAFHWDFENGLSTVVEEEKAEEDIVEGNNSEGEDDEANSNEDSDDNLDDAYCYHSFPDDEEWESRWRVYLQHLYDKLWCSLH